MQLSNPAIDGNRLPAIDRQLIGCLRRLTATGPSNMPTDALFAAAKATPYWWEDAPRAPRDDTVLPRQADVVVIGGGYTGLSAARETARAGRNTVVIDAEAIGWGCSSRNGGQVSTSIKPAFSDLSGKHNEDLAFRIRREGINALDFTRDLIRSEGIDCDWRQVGRFHAAHTRKHYDALAAAAKDQPKGLEVAMEMVPRAEQGERTRQPALPRRHGGTRHRRRPSSQIRRRPCPPCASGRRHADLPRKGRWHYPRWAAAFASARNAATSTPAMSSLPPTATPARRSPGSDGGSFRSAAISWRRSRWRAVPSATFRASG